MADQTNIDFANIGIAMQNLQKATTNAGNITQTLDPTRKDKFGAPMQPTGKPSEVKDAAILVSNAAETLYNAAAAQEDRPKSAHGDEMPAVAQKIAEFRAHDSIQCVVLWGYLDPSPDIRGDVRLYLSMQLDEYLQISKDAIAASISLRSGYRPLAGSLVWVKSGALIKRVTEETSDKEADFFKGAIAKGFLQTMNVSSWLGLDDLTKSAAEPGSGGGCGSGAVTPPCPH